MPLDTEDRLVAKVIASVLLGLTFLIALGMYGCPKYRVWQQGLAGEAELMRAVQNRQIAIEEAKAKEESAASLARAEVTRAKGIAEAQAIVNQTLTERYIQWMMAEKLSEQAAVIYVPTEAQIPLLEAGRRP